MRRIPGQTPLRRLGEIRQTLIEKRADIISNLGMKFDGLASMGRVAEEDQVAISHEEFITLQRNSLDYSQLLQIEEALERLERGGYGTCEGCQEPIPARRLDALPWARYCVDCQHRLDENPEEALVPVESAWPK